MNDDLVRAVDRISGYFGVEPLESFAHISRYESGSKLYWAGESLGDFFFKYINPSVTESACKSAAQLNNCIKRKKINQKVLDKNLGHIVLIHLVRRVAGLLADEKGADTLSERVELLRESYNYKVMPIVEKKAELVFLSAGTLLRGETEESFQKFARLPFNKAKIYLKNEYGILI